MNMNDLLREMQKACAPREIVAKFETALDAKDWNLMDEAIEEYEAWC